MVVYLAGAMRSATTLVGQLAGTSPDLLFVGEVRSAFLWTPDARTCDCGKPRAVCPVWCQIEAGPELAEQVGLEYRLHHQLRLLFDARRRRTPLMVRLLRALARASAPQQLVDSSKTPAGIVLWRLAGEPVHIVHCIRNPFEVARAQADPATQPAGRAVRRTHSLNTWVVYNLLTVALRPFAASYTLVRFSDLRRDPGGVADRIWRASGVRPGLHVDTGHAFDVGETHVLAANPRRTRRGTVVVRTPSAP